MREQHSVENLAKKACKELKCRLYLLEQSPKSLQVYVDKDGGVNLLDCEKIASRLSLFLSAEGLKDERVLEVSSPGLNRKLKYPWHFCSAVGKDIFIEIKTPYEGQKKFTGRLTQADEQEVVIETSSQMNRFSFQVIRKAYVIFNNNSPSGGKNRR